jgi:hypothetical protein
MNLVFIYWILKSPPSDWLPWKLLTSKWQCRVEGSSLVWSLLLLAYVSISVSCFSSGSLDRLKPLQSTLDNVSLFLWSSVTRASTRYIARTSHRDEPSSHEAACQYHSTDTWFSCRDKEMSATSSAVVPKLVHPTNPFHENSKSCEPPHIFRLFYFALL